MEIPRCLRQSRSTFFWRGTRVVAIRVEGDFEDADQFLEQIKLWGWQGVVRLTGVGGFRVSLKMAGDEKATALRTAHNMANLREVHTPDNARTFGLVIPNGSTNAWCGQSFDRAILQMMPRSDYVASNGRGHLGYQLMFHDEVVGEYLEALERLDGLDPSAHCIEMDIDRAVEIAEMIDRVWLGPDGKDPRAAADQVLPFLLEFFSKSAAVGRIRPEGRRRAVGRAREFIEANLGEAFTLADVCRVVGASRRTLTEGFREVLGMSPMRYVKLMRLNRARDALLRAAPATVKIVDVANAVGFWHMGQFAQDYRKVFGELPGETLAR